MGISAANALSLPPMGMSPQVTSNAFGNSYYQPIMQQAQPLIPPGPVQTPAGPLAQTVPLSPLSSVIPPPDAIAPCLFNKHLPYGYGYIPPGMSNFYQYNPTSYYSWGQPNQPPAAQPIASPAAQNKPPEPLQPANKKESEPLPKSIEDTAQLTPAMVQKINEKLSNKNRLDGEETRLEGATDLGKIFETTPELLSKPQYRKYAEALLLKVLDDPSSIVRQPIIMQMRLNNIQDPTPAILSKLNTLSKRSGLYGFEANDIKDILAQYKNGQKAGLEKALASKQPPGGRQLTFPKLPSPPENLPEEAPMEQQILPPVPPGQALAAANLTQANHPMSMTQKPGLPYPPQMMPPRPLVANRGFTPGPMQPGPMPPGMYPHPGQRFSSTAPSERGLSS